MTKMINVQGTGQYFAKVDKNSEEKALLDAWHSNPDLSNLIYFNTNDRTNDNINVSNFVDANNHLTAGAKELLGKMTAQQVEGFASLLAETSTQVPDGAKNWPVVNFLTALNNDAASGLNKNAILRHYVAFGGKLPAGVAKPAALTLSSCSTILCVTPTSTEGTLTAIKGALTNKDATAEQVEAAAFALRELNLSAHDMDSFLQGFSQYMQVSNRVIVNNLNYVASKLPNHAYRVGILFNDDLKIVNDSRITNLNLKPGQKLTGKDKENFIAAVIALIKSNTTTDSQRRALGRILARLEDKNLAQDVLTKIPLGNHKTMLHQSYWATKDNQPDAGVLMKQLYDAAASANGAASAFHVMQLTGDLKTRLQALLPASPPPSTADKVALLKELVLSVNTGDGGGTIDNKRAILYKIFFGQNYDPNNPDATPTTLTSNGADLFRDPAAQ